MYAAGSSGSANFPTENALIATKPTAASTTAAIAAKFTPDGQPVYSTFLGGTGASSANAIAVNGSGQPFLLLQVTSNDLPTLDAIQPSLSGSWDVYIVQLDGTGTQRLFATYFGGTGYEDARSLAYDHTGALIFCGSRTLPASRS